MRSSVFPIVTGLIIVTLVGNDLAAFVAAVTDNPISVVTRNCSAPHFADQALADAFVTARLLISQSKLVSIGRLLLQNPVFLNMGTIPTGPSEPSKPEITKKPTLQGKLMHTILSIWREQKSIWKTREDGIGPPDRGDILKVIEKFFFGAPFIRVLNPPGVVGRPGAFLAFRLMVPVYAVGAYILFRLFSGPTFGFSYWVSALLTIWALNIIQLYAEQVISREQDLQRDPAWLQRIAIAEAFSGKRARVNKYVDDSVRKTIVPILYGPMVRILLIGVFVIQAIRDGAFWHHVQLGLTLMLHWGVLPLLLISLAISIIAISHSRRKEGEVPPSYSARFLLEMSLIAPVVEEVALRLGALRLQTWLFVKFFGLSQIANWSPQIFGHFFEFSAPLGVIFAVLLNVIFFHQGHKLEHRNSVVALPVNLALSASYATSGSVVVSTTIHWIWNTLTAIYHAWAAWYTKNASPPPHAPNALFLTSASA